MNKRARLTPGKQSLMFLSQPGLVDDVPTEFRIFRAGVNDTSKGPALFDAEAADNVMRDWRTWGVDLMIDLEHQSLEADAEAREDAADARGWFGLEVRNGELWATNVTWTADGTRRLTEKTQRYLSPVFDYDRDTGRVLGLLNVALCAMPATHRCFELVAASRSSASKLKPGYFFGVDERASLYLSRIKSNKAYAPRRKKVS